MADTAFKIVNAKQFQATISKKERLLKRQGGHGGPYHMAVIYLDGWIQRNFKQEGKLAMGGGGWKPLALSTQTAIARTARGGKGKKQVKLTHRPKILQDTGALRMKWRHDYNNRRAIIENYATAKGSTYYYGVAHDEGRGHMPERRILPKEKQVAKKIKQIFGHWVRTSLK